MSIVKSYSVGNGDMFCIQHGSDNFTIIDCHLTDDIRQEILDDIAEMGEGKSIKRFISTHPDEDHLLGLIDLDDEISIVNFYVVKNRATKEDESADFKHYCELRDSKKAFYIERNCKRKWMNQEGDGRGSSGIHVVWPIVSNQDFKDELAAAEEGGSPNNISAVIRYSLENGPTFLWMGDLETDFMERIQSKINWPKVDILFAPHHGRASGKVPQAILDRLEPKIIVIGEAPSKHLHYYDGYNTITQNSAGDLKFDCQAKKVHIYASSHSYSVDFLDDELYEADYLGTLNL